MILAYMNFWQALGAIGFILIWIIPLGILEIWSENKIENKLQSGEWFLKGNGN